MFNITLPKTMYKFIALSCLFMMLEACSEEQESAEHSPNQEILNVFGYKESDKANETVNSPQAKQEEIMPKSDTTEHMQKDADATTEGKAQSSTLPMTIKEPQFDKDKKQKEIEKVKPRSNSTLDF